MIPSGLPEIFSAMAVGMLVLFSLLGIWWTYLSRVSWIRPFQSEHLRFLQKLAPNSESSRALLGIYALGLVFLTYGVGQVSEDLTDKLTDSDFKSNVIGPSILVRNWLGSEGYHRFLSIIEVEDKVKTSDNNVNPTKEQTENPDSEKTFKVIIQPTGLGKEVLAIAKKGLPQCSFNQNPEESEGNQLLSAARKELQDLQLPLTKSNYEEYIHNSSSLVVHKKTNEVRRSSDIEATDDDYKPLKLLKTDELKSLIQSTYYRAKNWTYQDSNYFKELEGIQRRIDFCRSCAHVAAWTLCGHFTGLLGVLVLVPLFVFVRFVFDQYSRRKETPYWMRLRDGYHWEQLITRMFPLLIVNGCILVVCINGYYFAEENFNERAFGYYRSQLEHECWKRPSSKEPSSGICCDAIPNSLFDVGAVYWVQSAPEFAAVTHQAYQMAQHSLDRLIVANSSVALPLAVVMDLDETVLDNSAFQGELSLTGREFTAVSWSNWERYYGHQTRLVPGALSFIQHARRANVQVWFVSNRDHANRKMTLQTLHQLGVLTTSDPDDRVLLKTDEATSSKALRFQQVQQVAHVVMWVGDQAGDFPSGLPPRVAGNVADKQPTVETIVIPNPMYGGWRRELNPENWQTKLTGLMPIGSKNNRVPNTQIHQTRSSAGGAK